MQNIVKNAQIRVKTVAIRPYAESNKTNDGSR
jgi:hypothetical protein